MLFKKKRIRQKERERLVRLIGEMKHQLERQQAFVSKSVEPSREVLADVKLTEAKYLFLLKEARQKKVSGVSK
ncbi:YaaL family protein [Thalassorhabdus alkalitolerans]|uniref:YaaL family protein n=1 Tax=Thalassorhabdus alkalitolerans TaxID=2282697 RepID=A0ABW0YMI5_9BACI|nr:MULTISPECIES: YaaL family protein [Bacillaceae]